jgi:hypothetical protein
MVNANSYARLAGGLYLVPLVCGPFSMMYVPSVVFAEADAATTAHRLVASQTLFRAGLVSDVTIVLAEIVLTAALYVLLRPAGRLLAATAAFARVAMAALQAANVMPLLAALHLVEGGSSLSEAERQSLALLALDLHGLGVHIWETVFGLHCLALGVLVVRSRFLPRALGVLLGVAAVGYLLNGIGNLAMPGGARVYAAVVAVGAVAGEVPFLLWLLVKGVDVERWEEAARG